MAVITEEDTAYVEAQFRLEPVDYARIQIGSRADVELPNRQVVRGKVSAISVATSDGVAFTTVQIQAPDLRRRDLSAFAQPGSPVAVTLTLHDDGIRWPGRPTPSWSSCTGWACADAGRTCAPAALGGAPRGLQPLVHGRDRRQRAAGRGNPPARRRSTPLRGRRWSSRCPNCACPPTCGLPRASPRRPTGGSPGSVFGDEPQPVFPLPLTFGMDDSSFGFGLPQIVTTADHIVGSNSRRHRRRRGRRHDGRAATTSPR